MTSRFAECALSMRDVTFGRLQRRVVAACWGSGLVARCDARDVTLAGFSGVSWLLAGAAASLPGVIYGGAVLNWQRRDKCLQTILQMCSVRLPQSPSITSLINLYIVHSCARGTMPTVRWHRAPPFSSVRRRWLSRLVGRQAVVGGRCCNFFKQVAY